MGNRPTLLGYPIRVDERAAGLPPAEITFGESLFVSDEFTPDELAAIEDAWKRRHRGFWNSFKPEIVPVRD